MTEYPHRHGRLASARPAALPAPVHRLQGARGQGHAGHRARRGRLPLRFGRPADSRRHGGALVRQRRATAAQSWRTRRYRQMLELPYYNSFFQTAHPPAIELAATARRSDAAAVQPRLLHGLGVRSQRYRRAHGAALLGPARAARSHGDHQPRERLSRQHDGRAQAWVAWRSCTRRAACPSPASSTSVSRTGTATAATCRPRNSGWWRRARSSRKSWSSAPTRSRHSSASPSRAPAASSFRRRRTGPRSSASASGTASCWWPTK